MDKKFKMLKEKIDSCDVISFDIFDTLIMRQILVPEDLFDIVANKALKCGINKQDFKEMRLNAINKNSQPNPNIYEIYDKMVKDGYLSETQSKLLLKLELESEMSVSVCRIEVKKLFDYAKENGKKVYLITDMYLPSSFIERLLKRHKIEGYHALYVSCEYRSLKSERLFAIFKETVKESKFLHIGDNKKSDGECALKNGIDVVLIDSAITKLKRSAYAHLLDETYSINDRSLLGLIISEIFNNPFLNLNESGEITIQRLEDIGFAFYGSIITEFMHWFIGEIEGRGYAKILFSARDGYLFNELYTWYCEKCGDSTELPKGIYFLTSRSVCTGAWINNINDIMWLMDNTFYGVDEALLEKRLFMDSKNIQEYKVDNNRTLKEYAITNSERIIYNSAKIRKGYLNYMARIGLKDNEKYAFFDLVSSGTCQYFLSQFAPFAIDGFYFCKVMTDEERKNCLPISSFTVKAIDKKSEYDICNNYHYFEFYMSCDMASLWSFTQDGKPLYNEETRSLKEINEMERVQVGIIEFFKQFMDRLYIPKKPMSLIFADNVLRHLHTVDISDELIDIDEVELTDDWVYQTLKIKR